MALLAGIVGVGIALVLWALVLGGIYLSFIGCPILGLILCVFTPSRISNPVYLTVSAVYLGTQVNLCERVAIYADRLWVILNTLVSHLAS